MIKGDFALAFSAGMLASVNPCGFAMLPAYLSYFVGTEASRPADEPAYRAIARALRIGATLSAGFITVFAVIGVIISLGAERVQRYARWPTVAIGCLLVVLGIAMLFGYKLPFATPRLDKGGRSRTTGSMFVFGISYAVASISCGLPVFSTLIIKAFDRINPVSGLIMFVLYGLGMGLVITSLTVALAFARQGLLHGLREVMKRADRIAGALLIATGLFLVWYRGLESSTSSENVVERWASHAEQFIADHSAVQLGMVFGAVVVLAGAYVAVRARRTSHRPPEAPPDRQPEATAARP